MRHFLCSDLQNIKKNQIKMKKLASRETPHSGQRDCVTPWKKKNYLS